MGNVDIWSELNTMIYAVEFPGSKIRPNTAYVIAGNSWAQVDTDWQRDVIFDSIIDHHVDSSVIVAKENIHCFEND